MENLSHEQAYRHMRRMLNEKQWRQYLAVEAKERGSVSLVAREAAVSVNTVKRGLCELEAGENYQPGERVRKKRGREEKAGGDRCDAAGRSGAGIGTQRRSDEPAALDEQVPGPSRGGPGSQRAPDQEIGPGRDLARSWVFFARP